MTNDIIEDRRKNLKLKKMVKIMAYDETFTNNLQEKSILKFEVKEDSSVQSVEVEILASINTEDKRKEIYQEISDIDARLSIISSRVDELNSEIDSLTNHADGIDYTIAVASGIVAGIIDSLWVGELSIGKANELGGDKVNKFVVKIAQKKGYKGNELSGAVSFLEREFPIAADSVTNDFGGGLQHHLRDFSHHPTPVGLLFSLLTQLTGNVYGTDIAGNFKSVPVNTPGLIGRNFQEKFTFGVINWFFHMVSDMAGSSGSLINGRIGNGLPGPMVSFLKEVSSLPIFRTMDANGYKEISVWISKLFNGTLINENSNERIPFDLRTEIGIKHQLGRQAIPIIINECIVRGFYFARRLFNEIKSTGITNVRDLKKINWKNTLPVKNRTVVRMLTISTSTFMAFDIIDAAIRSGGFNAACILRLNFVGIGRFAIAVGTDIGMGIKKRIKEREKTKLTNEQIQLLNAKMFYKQADVWIEAKKTDEAIKEVYIIMNHVAIDFAKTWQEVANGSDNRKKYIDSIKENNSDFADELYELLEWGN